MALLEDHEFGEEELGGVVAFIGEAGVGYLVKKNLEVGYRFWHMSNAGIYDHNPGVNLHVFGLTYHF